MKVHPYLLRPLRTIDEVLIERAIRSLMWEQMKRDRAIAKWQERDNDQR